MQLKRLNGISCTFYTTTEISQMTLDFHECGIVKDAMKFNAKTFCSSDQPQIFSYYQFLFKYIPLEYSYQFIQMSLYWYIIIHTF